MKPELAFGLAVHDEALKQLDWCLGHLRAAYPSVPVFVIDDGGRNPGYADVCTSHGCDYHRGERLKAVRHGCRWWQRFFTTALRYDWHYCFKMDPDTRLHRPFRCMPENLDVFGTVERECDVQGGLQGFRRECVRRVVDSGVCLDPVYADVAAWGTAMTRNYTRNTGQISTDHSLAHIVRRLKLTWGAWDEVDCQWRKTRPFRDGVAATHPHKL
jgi:hypothetical protein